MERVIISINKTKVIIKVNIKMIKIMVMEKNGMMILNIFMKESIIKI